MSGNPILLIGATRELSARDLANPDSLPAPPKPTIATLRYSHHRLAQLLANGTKPAIAARLCNYSPSRVESLRNDPAFQELLALYGDEQFEEWADFNRLASDLSVDFLGRLQQLLDEKPESFSPSTILEAVKVLADRTGHAPVTKSLSVNVNTDIGDRMLAARERVRQAQIMLEGQI